MGRCVRLASQPPQLNIQIPGGAVLGSIANQTQTHPNALDPAASLMQAAAPALSAIKPAIDIVAFVMAIIQIFFTVLTLIGLALGIVAPGNPLSTLFPVPNVKDENGDDIHPPVPDPSGPFLDIIDNLYELICRGMKLLGLVPQLSAIATVKDTLITALQIMDAVQGEVNSSLDRIEAIVPPPTGIPEIDNAIECARERLGDALGSKMGILASLAPLMEIVSILAELIAQPLPRVIYTMANLLIEAGILSFPDEESKQQVLDIVDEMTTTGITIDIPDFGDLDDILSKMQELKDKLGPLLPVIETIQLVVNKLTNC